MYHIKELNTLTQEQLEAIALKQNIIQSGEEVAKEDFRDFLAWLYDVLFEGDGF